MAKLGLRTVKVVDDPEYKVVGKNKTPLLTFTISEDERRKVDGKWKTVGHNFFDVEMWGDRATEGSLEIQKDVLLDLSPTIEEGDKGQYISYNAEVYENTFKADNGKEYHNHKVKIWNYEIVERNDG